MDDMVIAYKLGVDAKLCGRLRRDVQFGVTTALAHAWVAGFNRTN